MKYLLVIVFATITLTGFIQHNKTSKIVELEVPNDSKGKTLWVKYCIACHHVSKKIVGPALGPAMQVRERSWLIQYVKDYQILISDKDSIALALRKTSDIDQHPKFDTILTDKEIRKILNFIKISSLKN
ncbi:hypothetical protein BH09BAC1_BH09BAC1_03690 [soil metagenome]